MLIDKSKHAAEVFDKNALLYQDKFMNVELYHHALDKFCDNIVKPNAEVLDIACGSGNITKYLLQKRPDLKILGIDLSQNMIDLATKNNPQANFRGFLKASMTGDRIRPILENMRGNTSPKKLTTGMSADRMPVKKSSIPA